MAFSWHKQKVLSGVPSVTVPMDVDEDDDDALDDKSGRYYSYSNRVSPITIKPLET